MNSFNYKDAFRGFFDTDGSVGITVINRRTSKKNYNIPIGFIIKFVFSQALFNSSVFEVLENAFSKKQALTLYFSNRLRSGTTNQEVRSHILFSSPLGKEIVQLCTSDGRIFHPRALNDLLVAKTLNALLEKKLNSTKQGLVTLIYLAYQTFNQQNPNSTIIKKKDINQVYAVVDPTSDERRLGIQEGERYTKDIRLEVEQHTLQLAKTRLTNDYLVGAHYGDGSLNMVYNLDDSTYNFKPTWSVTDACVPYLEAIHFTLGVGRLHGVGKNRSCLQYVLDGQKRAIETILPIFDGKPLPSYKKQQFRRFKLAVLMLKRRRHLSLSGAKLMLNLTYDMSKNSRRTKSKEQYLEHYNQYRKTVQPRPYKSYRR